MLDFRVNSRSRSRTQPSSIREEHILPQDIFIRMLCTERRRSYRSGSRFILMLLDPGKLLRTSAKPKIMANLLQAMAQSARDTDLKGWYQEGSVLGVIFTELGAGDDKTVVQSLSGKVTSALYEHLHIEHINEIRLSFHVFPEDWDDNDPGGPAGSTLQVVLERETNRQNSSLLLKRLMDIAGSIGLMAVLSPVFLAITIAVKLTSKGPVLFRQTRLGEDGKKFTFLKFRSMYVNNDSSIHEQYVKRLIAGGTNDTAHVNGNQKVYKLTADPRITSIGRFIRKTSLDELPQFWNVLRGEMSLVGPRPPVMYEYESYSLWHRQRLASVKPGITGLWQVEGRSRVKFDDMVRMDIHYARTRSFWMDLKILLKTPRAVISGNGAC